MKIILTHKYVLAQGRDGGHFGTQPGFAASPSEVMSPRTDISSKELEEMWQEKPKKKKKKRRRRRFLTPMQNS